MRDAGKAKGSNIGADKRNSPRAHGERRGTPNHRGEMVWVVVGGTTGGECHANGSPRHFSQRPKTRASTGIWQRLEAMTLTRMAATAKTGKDGMRCHRNKRGTTGRSLVCQPHKRKLKSQGAARKRAQCVGSLSLRG